LLLSDKLELTDLREQETRSLGRDLREIATVYNDCPCAISNQ